MLSIHAMLLPKVDIIVLKRLRNKIYMGLLRVSRIFYCTEFHDLLQGV